MTTRIGTSALLAALRPVIESNRDPIFFVGFDAKRDRSEIHVAANGDCAGLEARARKALRQADESDRVFVRPMEIAKVVSARTLEDLVRPFAHLTGLFDPTAIVGRARVVASAVAAARQALGRQVKGAYLDPVSRILHVVVRQGVDAAVASAAFVKAIDDATQATGSRFNRPPLSVHVSTELPLRALVPVDRASARLLPVIGNRKGLKVALAGMAAAFGIGGVVSVAAAQQSAPAVAGVNAKIDARGGYAQIEAERIKGLSGFATGALTAPLGQQFGIQVDGAVGSADGELYLGAGAHMFWRDPAQGLVGVFGQYGVIQKGQLYRLGVEGEAYFGSLTLGGHVGYEIGDDSRRVHVDDGVIAGAKLKFYADENLAFNIGGGIEHTSGYGRACFEFQPGMAALPGLSVFADAGIGTDHHSFAMAGIRYYFGETKSLIRRHREDDPDLLPLVELQKYERRHHAKNGTGPYPPP